MDAVIGEIGVERELCVRVGRRRRSERSSDDHLGRRIRGLTLRKARGIRVTGRREERVCLVDAVVDDRDLHSLSCGRERRAPDRRRADELRRPVEQRVVADARPDLSARHPRERAELRARDDDGEAVEDDPKAPADPSGGNPRPDPGL